jgi:hypothetical protein
MLATQCVENTLSLMEESITCQINSKNGVGDGFVTVLPEFVDVTCFRMQLIPGDFSIFKSTPFPVAGSFTVIA